MKKCWICGGKELTDEHKFKSSVLRRFYGKKYKGNTELFYVVGTEDAKSVKNYKDHLLKFNETICKDCNNILTKPHDDAYDSFISYIENNYEELRTAKKIDFSLIYGLKWQDEQLNLYKYFAKHAGCKIFTGEYPYDLGKLAEFIRGGKLPDNFKVHFQIKEAIKKIIERSSNTYFHLYNGPTIFINETKSFGYFGWTSCQWFTVNWFFSDELDVNKKMKTIQESPIEILSFENYKLDFQHLNIHSIEEFGIETLDLKQEWFLQMTK